MNEKTDDIVQYIAPPSANADPAQFTLHERTLLENINQKVAAHESTEAILDFFFDQMRGICPCDRISIAFAEEDGKRLVSNYTCAAYSPVMLKKGYAEDLRGSSLQRVLETGDLRIINDLEQYLQDKPSSAATRLLVKEGVLSSLTTPMVVDDRIIGVMFRSTRRKWAYDDHQAVLHSAVAERLSQAIEKTWRIEQLQAANQAYTEMLGFVSHELKSPVASLVTSAQMLRDGYLGDINEKQRDATTRMIDKGRYLLDLVKEYLDLAQIESGNIAFEPHTDVNFKKDVVDVAVDIVTPQLQMRHAELFVDSADETPGLCLDPSLLKIVMVNLLTNAVKYGFESGEVRLTVDHSPQRLHVSVWNRGPGFPESERPRLFRKFSRLRTKELQKIKGTGVGLYTVWRIIQQHGGLIRARSEPGEWAEFYFEIPQPLLEVS